MRNFLATQGFHKYFANTSWLLGERILRMTISLFVGIYVARYLGPERYGLLSYALSFVLLFSALASLGLDDILVRELVNHPDKRQNLLGTVFWLKVFGTVVMGTAISAVLQFKAEDQQTYWMIALITFGFLFQATNVVDFFFSISSSVKICCTSTGLSVTPNFPIQNLSGLEPGGTHLVRLCFVAGSGCSCSIIFAGVSLESRVVPVFFL